MRRSLLIATLLLGAALVGAQGDDPSMDDDASAGMVGTTCGTVSPDSRCDCCDSKGGEEGDSWCSDNYSSECGGPGPVGTTCGTVSPDSRCDCCDSKGGDDPWCQDHYANQCATPVGTTCGTVTPSDRCECCDSKGGEDSDDSWCQDNYTSECTKPPGSSCSSVSPGDRCECCDGKKNMSKDNWCKSNYADECEAPTPPIGSSCASVGPSNSWECCVMKMEKGQKDSWCKSEYPELWWDGGHDHNNNLKDYPFMAYIESELGICGGSLIAPGYVLTAAQCVYKSGKALSADQVAVWVSGEWLDVEAVHVAEEDALFSEFANDKDGPSWDVAVLALKQASTAQWVALPTSDVPVAGEQVEQTAWLEEEQYVESAWITVESVNAGWTDDFTAGGPAFISDLCPYDKGSPALMYPEEGEPALQVGLTSGPGCDDEKRDGAGLFVRLADKELLAQLMVWLNSREGTDNSGLDDGVRAWMQAANEYIYS